MLCLIWPAPAYSATRVLGESMRAALRDAQAWLVGRSVDPSADETAPDGNPPPDDPPDHIVHDAAPPSSREHADHDRPA